MPDIMLIRHWSYKVPALKNHLVRKNREQLNYIVVNSRTDVYMECYRAHLINIGRLAKVFLIQGKLWLNLEREIGISQAEKRIKDIIHVVFSPASFFLLPLFVKVV